VTDERRPTPTLIGRSPLAAAALSFVFPGAGQLYLGRRVWAVAFAVPAILAGAWLALQLSNGLVYFAASMLDEQYALAIMAFAGGVTAWRIAAIVQPFVGHGRRSIGRTSLAGLGVLLAVAVGMGGFVANDAYAAWSAARRIATNDFHSGGDVAEAAPTPTGRPFVDWSWLYPSDSPATSVTPIPGCEDYPNPTATPGDAADIAADLLPLRFGAVEPAIDPTASPSPSPSPSPTPTPTPTPTAIASASASASTSPSPSPTAGPAHRLTVLLTGVDFMAGRTHAQNDTLMLVSLDLRTGGVAMISVPRDTAGFPFYWGGQAPSNFRINYLANAVAGGQFGSPDTPMVTLANEIGYLVGIKVDYWAEIDMDGFRQLIDLVGGVDIDNPRLLDDPFTCTYVPAGRVHLDGAKALKYVRSRESTSDYDRAARQQRVMIALEKKMATPTMVAGLNTFLDLAGRSIATNFPLNRVRDYVDAAQHINSISTCVLSEPYNYHPDMSETGGYWVSRLVLAQVANLSVHLFGADSLYYGRPGVSPGPCRS
jgi:LCP family protein required for cell wall assembly